MGLLSYADSGVHYSTLRRHKSVHNVRKCGSLRPRNSIHIYLVAAGVQRQALQEEVAVLLMDVEMGFVSELRHEEEMDFVVVTLHEKVLVGVLLHEEEMGFVVVMLREKVMVVEMLQEVEFGVLVCQNVKYLQTTLCNNS